jgi:hypothetical protein
MAKKAKRQKINGVRPERTASRLAPAEETPRTFQFDKLGTVLTWKLPTAPYKGDVNLRPAYIGGFESRVRQVQNGGLEEGVAIRFAENSKEQRAFADGYHEAANQDGQSHKARALTGTNPPPAKKKR